MFSLTLHQPNDTAPRWRDSPEPGVVHPYSPFTIKPLVLLRTVPKGQYQGHLTLAFQLLPLLQPRTNSAQPSKPPSRANVFLFFSLSKDLYTLKQEEKIARSYIMAYNRPYDEDALPRYVMSMRSVKLPLLSPRICYCGSALQKLPTVREEYHDATQS